MLKILIVIKQSNDLEEYHGKLGDEAIELLLSSSIKGSGLEAIDKLKIKWEEAEPAKRL
jgi:hypothetical protein